MARYLVLATNLKAVFQFCEHQTLFGFPKALGLKLHARLLELGTTSDFQTV
jgi:hypothetical protein